MYRWGMVIDLDRCTACQACVVACRQENNIPIMGEEYAKLGRAKFWMNLIHETKGTYPDVAIFFDKVSKMPRIVNISGVSMEGAKEVFGRWEITTSCTATTFKFIEKVTTDLPKDKKAEDKKGVLPGKK